MFASPDAAGTVASFVVSPEQAWDIDDGDPLMAWLNKLLYQNAAFKVTRIDQLKNGTVVCDAIAYLEVRDR